MVWLAGILAAILLFVVLLVVVVCMADDSAWHPTKLRGPDYGEPDGCAAAREEQVPRREADSDEITASAQEFVPDVELLRKRRGSRLR